MKALLSAPAIEVVSENALLLTWPETINPELHVFISKLQQTFTAELSPYLIDSVISYNAIMLYYHFNQISLAQFILKVERHIVEQLTAANTLASTVKNKADDVIDIPVYYGEEAGWDLAAVAKQTALSPADVIAKHSATTYRAFALGFTPGFCYLGTLDTKLQLPRRSSPRLNIPKGAVAIAEQQTAIYPNTSPGGWHIIGQTPINMYHVTNKGVGHEQTFQAKINVGQTVKFNSISYAEFCQLGGQLELSPHV